MQARAKPYPPPPLQPLQWPTVSSYVYRCMATLPEELKEKAGQSVTK